MGSEELSEDDQGKCGGTVRRQEEGWRLCYKHQHTAIRSSDLHLRAKESAKALKKWLKRLLFCCKLKKKSSSLLPLHLDTWLGGSQLTRLCKPTQTAVHDLPASWSAFHVQDTE